MVCKICGGEHNNISYHVSVKHKIDYIDYLLSYNLIKQPYCKVCNKEIDIKSKNSSARKKIIKGIIPKYCSNKCKFSDSDYNKIRSIKKVKNDKNKECKCNICGGNFNDVNNLSGILTKHLSTIHNITESYKDYFTILNKKENKISKWNCPHCQWETIDVNNSSGSITTHILTHYSNISQFISIYPEYSNLFKTYISNMERQSDINNDGNNVTCLVCNKKFYKITSTHLKKHNLTVYEYKKKFNVDNIISEKSRNKQIAVSNDPIIKNKMIKSLLKTNNKKYNCNSFTQTKLGKDIIRRKTFENTYDKYIKSDKLLSFVELMFDKDDYSGNRKEYDFRCTKCGNIFKGKIENGRIPRCLNCYPKHKGFSKAEKEVFNYIKDEFNINVESDKKIGDVEVDIFIPDFNIAIEYNGLFWHSEINGEKDKKYHLNKTKVCEENGIQLIHIFEDEWIFKRDIVKNKIKTILKFNNNRIYARNCDIHEISNKDKNLFLEENHLQGGDISSYKLGLFYNGELVSVMTFSNFKYNKVEKTVYELSRFAVKGNYIVIGSFSKLLKYFIRNYNPTKIITFADRRWSIEKSNVYIKNNFKLVSITNPSHWYLDKLNNRYHRFNFRKSVLKNKLDIYDDSLSEWENMQMNKYDRIWDCGSYKYELEI